MARNILLTLLLLLSITTLRATNVDFLLTDSRLSIGSATNRTVYVQPMSVPSATASSVVIGTRLTFITDTNGEFVFTNAMSGLYACSVQAPPSRTDFKILVTATNLGTVYAADCLVADSTATFPSGAVAWSAAVTDSRYARATTSLSNYATIVYVTNIVGGLSNALGSAAFSNSTAFYPASNPSNYISTASTNGLATVAALTAQGVNITNTFTNLLALQGVVMTNSFSAQGTAVTNFSLAIGLSATNFTKLCGTSVTNFILSTSNALAAQFGSSASYQPASLTLTNWALHSTNDYVGTNTYISFTNSLGSIIFSPITAFQATSTVLTAFGNLGTNAFYPRFSNPSNYLTATTVTNIYVLQTNGLAEHLTVTNLTVYNGGVLQGANGTGLVLQNPSTATFQNIITLDGNQFTLTVDTATNFLDIYVRATNMTTSQSIIPQVGKISKSLFASALAPSITNTISAWVSSNFYPLLSNPSNYVTTSGSNVFYLTSNPSNFVTASITNGYATTGYVSTATNSLYAITQPSNAVLSALVTFGTNFWYPRLNPSNYVTASVTNGLYPSSNPSNYVTISVTNGLYPSSNPSNFVTATITNSLASTGYVATATNTLAGNISALYYLKSNPSNFVSQTIWATNNPSNIVVSAASIAYWTNGAEWKCLTGSNWFPTVLP